MAYKFINNYETKLTAQATAAATSITVANAAGLSLAVGEVYRMTIQNADASLYEIVDVTAISSNTLTIERAKEGTTAQAWASGSTVLCGVTAEQLDKLNSSGSGSSSETWYTATSNTLNIANGSKQKRTLTENATLAFTLSDGDDITLILNPSTFTVMWPTITWFGSAPVLTASKEHTIVISKDGSVLRGWWQVAASSLVSNWIFVPTDAWVVGDAGKTARLNSGYTDSWQVLETNSNKRSVTTGKYYFEVLVTKYNVGNEQALRIGIDQTSDFLVFLPRGTVVRKENALIPYMQPSVGDAYVGLWGLNDVIGCSIEPSGDGNTNVRFYINGVDAGLGKNPYKISGVPAVSVYVRGYRDSSARDIEIKNQDLKHLPTGFEPW